MSSGLIDTTTGVPPALENSPAVLPPDGTAGHHWAVVLAGGDGTRLQSLTLRIAGDRRPKQFCSFFGGETLLTQTRARLESLFQVDRELFVVTRSHETYYREELRNVDESRIIPQPLNRGTGVAVAVALVHILQRDPDAVVVLVPCDHYYSNDEAFGRAIGSVISSAEQYPDAIVLLGAEARNAEIEYGWIEAGSAISDTPVPLFRVNRFWEKPSMLQAQELLRRGCLWNTFVTAGRASTFLDVLCTGIPHVVLAINNALADNDLERAYQDIPAVDLSREVFAPQPHRLLAICDTKSGWTDLGSPARVMEILGRRNTHPTWWPEGRESVLLSVNSNRDHASRDDSGQDVTGARYRARESLNNDRQNEVSKALDGAFCAAFMLTGSMQAAEHAVLNGIAATECYGAGDDAFLLGTIKAAIQRRADSPHQSHQRCAQLPLELRRLFLLAPISRDCFVLRILLGIPVGICSRILHRRVEEIEDVLCAALQDLARLEARSRADAKCRV